MIYKTDIIRGVVVGVWEAKMIYKADIIRGVVVGVWEAKMIYIADIINRGFIVYEDV